MSCNEEQEEELEVLTAIFEDDSAFKQVSKTCVQYKIGEKESLKSFLIEFEWPPDYPTCPLNINLNLFYNNRLLPEVKEEISAALTEQCNSMLGSAMTYSLIDWAKENHEELMAGQPEVSTRPDADESSKKKEKKEQLTKAQKRRLTDRFGVKNERARGWNWVDPIKHLSQTGGKEDE
ncbi:unnamed protein product [Clavelina lepadiformis]|uniref:RWD domain-containing protein n=1 Tax=Clavelina lepadiformis TaxID=159417 RepID=A0ABP0GAP9_CLALP